MGEKIAPFEKKNGKIVGKIQNVPIIFACAMPLFIQSQTAQMYNL